MKLAIKTCTLDMPYEEMLDFCVSQKIAAIEIGTGNWSGAPHCDLDLLVSDRTAREKWYDAVRAKGLELCALNCSGNPLAYEKEMDVTKKTFELAQMLGVKKIVMMSGLPAGCRGDKTPVWITTSWPPETQEILDYQWNEVAIPVWKDIVKMAEDCGIRLLCVDGAAAKRLQDSCSSYSVCTIPAGTYPGQEEEVQTVGVKAVLLASAALPEKQVEQLTKLLFDGRENLSTQLGIRLDTEAEATEGVGIPFHKGAAAYYKTADITVAS